MKPNGIDLFKVAGIQIAIDYSWIVIFFWTPLACSGPEDDHGPLSAAS